MKEEILIVEDEFIVANDLSVILRKAGYKVCGAAASVQEAKSLIDKFSPSWVLLDIFLQDGSKGTELAPYLTEKRIGFIYISANTNQKILEAAKLTQPYGFVVKPFREKDLLIMLEIAMEKHRENLLFDHHRQQMLDKQIDNVVNSDLNADTKLTLLPNVFQTLIPFDYLKLDIAKAHEQGVHEFSFLREGYEQYRHFQDKELPESLDLQKNERHAFKPKLPNYKKGALFNGMDFRQEMFDDPWERISCTRLELNSKLSFPVTLENGIQAALTFYSKKPEGFTASHLNLLKQVERHASQLIFNCTQESGGHLPTSFSVKERAAASFSGFEGIVGNSLELMKVLDSISLVSQSDISVLISGESGTGKEKVAQYIHKLSPRKNKPLITVNCAALPHELIESELFGHEKGAYTGAIEKRIGKFELANGGTIFLDEIGEMPLDAQVKLLRVLQEKEIDHLGGKHTIKVDVRVIAATNRKLEKEVAEGRFRLDLYYRLNVYPIELPPLRSRKEDIPLLAEHFLTVFAKETGRKIGSISQPALNQLQYYDWPGNIRELGHLIQRAMIKTTGTQITAIELPEKTQPQPYTARETELKTLEQVETEHILGVLKRCNGKVCGSGGAAEVLGLPPSTLNSKIKKLGIKRESYFNNF
jgi:formate hydrogenlyase transcriptional activator